MRAKIVGFAGDKFGSGYVSFAEYLSNGSCF